MRAQRRDRRSRARRGGVALLLASLLLAASAPHAAADVPGVEGQVDDPHRLLVTLAAPAGPEAVLHGLTDAIVVAGGADPVSAVHVLEFAEAQQLRAAQRTLAGRVGVLEVEVDRRVLPDWQVHEVHELVDLDGAAGSVRLASLPPGIPGSWGVDNDGAAIDGTAGRQGIDIGGRIAAPLADGRGVVVAVVDTGMDIAHPVLRDRIWRNPGEGVDGRDTDGNGFVDDINGWNFVRGTNRLYDGAQADAHGTHVAAIIAAQAVPELRFASVAPRATIMPIKAIDGERGGRTSDMVAAVRYAVDNGADLINASWGSPEPSAALRRVIAESPIPVVLAAGNLGRPLEQHPWYPAADALDTTVVVAAVSHDGRMADFSGTSRVLVDAAAPGDRILSAWPDRRMAVASGTSQAVPHVSGALALALQRHPGGTPAELAEAVRASVRPLAGVDRTRAGGIVRAPGLLDHLGTPVAACPQLDLAGLGFQDVSVTSPHRPAIACLLQREVTRGVTAASFGSERGLTRAQIATLVARTLEQADARPAAPAATRFEDVAATSGHRDAIEALAAVGIVQGTSATTYDPGRTTTRAELASVVARAAEYLAQGEVRARVASFPDTADSPDADWIDKAAGLRVVLGRPDGSFSPDAPVRRDQAASMVSRLLDRWHQQGVLRPAA